MAEFAYNNFQNASTGHTLFEINYSHQFWVFFKDKCNTYFRSSSAKGLVIELRKVINICYQNFLLAQDFQNTIYDKRMIP